MPSMMNSQLLSADDMDTLSSKGLNLVAQDASLFSSSFDSLNNREELERKCARLSSQVPWKYMHVKSLSKGVSYMSDIIIICVIMSHVITTFSFSAEALPLVAWMQLISWFEHSIYDELHNSLLALALKSAPTLELGALLSSYYQFLIEWW